MAAFFLVLGMVFHFSRPPLPGNINRSCGEPTTSTADFSFQAEAGERIRFSLASDLRAEELEIVLYDPTGNAVKRLDEAKALKTFAVLDTGGVYLLRAELCDLVGRFKAAVYRAP